jgi:hypothetical protein
MLVAVHEDESSNATLLPSYDIVLAAGSSLVVNSISISISIMRYKNKSKVKYLLYGHVVVTVPAKLPLQIFVTFLLIFRH